MQKWYRSVLFSLGVCALLFGITPLCKELVPREYHPQAWAMTFIGCAILLASLVPANAELSVFALAWGWTAWFTALLDKPCPSAIFGFVALALLYTCRYLASIRRDPKMDIRKIVFDISLVFGITFFIAAVFLSIHPL